MATLPVRWPMPTSSTSPVSASLSMPSAQPSVRTMTRACFSSAFCSEISRRARATASATRANLEDVEDDDGYRQAGPQQRRRIRQVHKPPLPPGGTLSRKRLGSAHGTCRAHHFQDQLVEGDLRGGARAAEAVLVAVALH